LLDVLELEVKHVLAVEIRGSTNVLEVLPIIDLHLSGLFNTEERVTKEAELKLEVSVELRFIRFFSVCQCV